MKYLRKITILTHTALTDDDLLDAIDDEDINEPDQNEKGEDLFVADEIFDLLDILGLPSVELLNDIGTGKRTKRRLHPDNLDEDEEYADNEEEEEEENWDE